MHTCLLLCDVGGCVFVCACMRACAWGIQTCVEGSRLTFLTEMNVYDHNYDFKLIKV